MTHPRRIHALYNHPRDAFMFHDTEQRYALNHAFTTQRNARLYARDSRLYAHYVTHPQPSAIHGHIHALCDASTTRQPSVSITHYVIHGHLHSWVTTST